MPQQALSRLTSTFARCDALIVSAHRLDAGGAHIFAASDQEQITHSAFLNMFIAWEAFLEEIIAAYMTGSPTINGSYPVRRVHPTSRDEAKRMIVGVMKYFDFANQEYVKQIAKIYFDNAYPIEPHVSSINSQLADLKTMRNACAHVTSTTQRALESLALRLFGIPVPGVTVYRMITTVHPANAPNTVYLTYQNVLLAAATQIAYG